MANISLWCVSIGLEIMCVILIKYVFYAADALTKESSALQEKKKEF